LGFIEPGFLGSKASQAKVTPATELVGRIKLSEQIKCVNSVSAFRAFLLRILKLATTALALWARLKLSTGSPSGAMLLADLDGVLGPWSYC